MPKPRFADCETLSPELVARIDRAVTRALIDVAEDPDTNATVTVEFRIRFHAHTNETVAEYNLKTQSNDSKSRCAGMVRDGQLTLPGTGILSDLEPVA